MEVAKRTNRGHFIKGQANPDPNNPNRTKKEETLSYIMKQMLNKKDVQYGFDVITRKQALVEKIWELAMKERPDIKVLRLLLEYTEGLPKQIIEQMGSVEITLVVPQMMQQNGKEENHNRLISNDES